VVLKEPEKELVAGDHRGRRRLAPSWLPSPDPSNRPREGSGAVSALRMVDAVPGRRLQNDNRR
jgi:hypothetical protein